MHENEQKQQLSFAYIHAVATRSGCSCQQVNVDDDSVDLNIAASGWMVPNAVLRSPKLDIQVKSTSQKILGDKELAYPLPIKNYNELRENCLVPRILVVFLLPENPDQWLEQTEEQMISRYCAYWISLQGKEEVENTNNITIRIPRGNIFSVETLKQLMERISFEVSL